MTIPRTAASPMTVPRVMIVNDPPTGSISRSAAQLIVQAQLTGFKRTISALGPVTTTSPPSLFQLFLDLRNNLSPQQLTQAGPRDRANSVRPTDPFEGQNSLIKYSRDRFRICG
jgi:hypothetical protein